MTGDMTDDMKDDMKDLGLVGRGAHSTGAGAAMGVVLTGLRQWAGHD
ncbi:hypothetical protein [Intrasporangium mesophilum]